MNSPVDKPRQRGYSLAEVLIAAAIAAGILAAVSSSLGGAARLSARGNEAAQILSEAKLIAARLKAGMDDDDVLAGLDGWRLDRAPYGGEQHASFDVVTAAYGEDAGHAFEFLARRRGEAR